MTVHFIFQFILYASVCVRIHSDMIGCLFAYDQIFTVKVLVSGWVRFNDNLVLRDLTRWKH